MKKVFFVVGMIFVFLVVTNTQSVADEEIIYGCYKKRGGNLRRVNGPGMCRQWEIELSWNIAGPPGLNCWDINSDSMCNPEEDVNTDGVCDALDCKGKKGDPGEPGSEGQQGPPGVGCIQAYDNETLLGTLMGIRPEGYITEDGTEVERSCNIYVSDIGKFVEFNLNGERITERFRPTFYFDLSDCEGTAYVDNPSSSAMVYYIHSQKRQTGNIIYGTVVWDTGLPCVDFQSKLNWGNCTNDTSSSCNAMPVTIIDNFPFDFPLEGPLTFK